MSKKLTNAQKNEIQKQELKVRNLVTIYLDDAPIRLLENDTITSFTHNGEVYLAGFVKRGDIKTSMENVGEKVEITISNIWQEISSIIATQGDTLTNRKCKIETVVFDGDSNTIIGEPVHLFEGFINNIALTALTFKFDVERILGGYSTLSPNATYDVNCQCRKFKDERCGYTGNAEKCDKTLTRCQEIGNVENFYGFPSLPKEMAD
ncbi:MAG: hypothetical protein LBK53_09230 [Heliobacteriaceae bacterium]|jgi:enamine deaminase RidA (YjgF/YER057c/UK114 family)|nr:hypothetical protein [Heliobacteriaceae bacterium]